MMLHEALKVELGLLQDCETKLYFMKMRRLLEWKKVPLPVSHCCDIPARNDIYAMQDGAALDRTCLKLTMTGDNNIGGQMAGERSLRDTKVYVSGDLKISKHNIMIVGNKNKPFEEEERKSNHVILKSVRS